MSYGVTPAGFVAKPAATVKAEIEASLKAGPLGASAGTEPDGSIPAATNAGQLVAILVDAIAAQWDLQQAVYSSFDPNQATGSSQDAVCAITGTQRDPKSFSTVTGTCTGDPGTVLNVGRVAQVVGTLARFDSGAALDPADPHFPASTLAALSPWVGGGHAYLVGDRVTNAQHAYQCITAGNSGGGLGPTAIGYGSSSPGWDITDGGAHWRYLGNGTAAVDVPFTSEVAAAIAALAGSMTQIGTPVGGWLGVSNFLDAHLGATIETDSALRIRRDSELSAEGNAAADAIRSHVLKVGQGSNNPVTSCRVFYNDTDTTDVDGVPPHSVEVLVLGGDDAAVALAVWQAVGAGTGKHGSTSVAITDEAGNTQTVHFTRPTQKTIWIRADVTYDPVTFPSDLTAGATLIKEALVLFGSSYPIGKSVRSSALEAQVFEGPPTPGAPPVPGILDVTVLYIRLVSPPISGATIAIGVRELAVFDTGRVTVNLTPGSP